MIFQNLEKVVQTAEKICKDAGVKFTSKRKEVFEVLLTENKALSAYEVAEVLKQKNKVSTPVMSIYRILDFLEQQKLVHKISSMSKYTVCAHITCSHGHDLPRLAICSRCLKVEELALNNPIKKELQSGLDVINFQLKSQQLELMGLCSGCRDVSLI